MTMKKVAVVPQLELPFRDPARVDAVIGKRRKSVKDCAPIDFSQCGLAQMYPDIEDYLGEVYKQRMAQKAGGPLAHPRAISTIRTKTRPLMGAKLEAPPWEDGPSAYDVHKAYPTKR